VTPQSLLCVPANRVIAFSMKLPSQSSTSLLARLARVGIHLLEGVDFF
jgi:hypothetical protein